MGKRVYNILIADDDAEILEAIAEILSERGYVVDTAPIDIDGKCLVV